MEVRSEHAAHSDRVHDAKKAFMVTIEIRMLNRTMVMSKSG